MKKVLIITVSLCLFGLVAPSNIIAAKADGAKAKIIAKYDKNSNGVIDGDEKEALRKDFEKDPNGDLKQFDKNGDGKLDDDEISAIKPGSGNKKEKKEKSKDTEKKKEADKPKDGADKKDK